MKNENAEIAKRLSHRKHKDKRRKWCTSRPSKPCDHCHGCEGFPDPYGGEIPLGIELEEQ